MKNYAVLIFLCFFTIAWSLMLFGGVSDCFGRHRNFVAGQCSKAGCSKSFQVEYTGGCNSRTILSVTPPKLLELFFNRNANVLTENEQLILFPYYGSCSSERIKSVEGESTLPCGQIPAVAASDVTAENLGRNNQEEIQRFNHSDFETLHQYFQEEHDHTKYLYYQQLVAKGLIVAVGPALMMVTLIRMRKTWKSPDHIVAKLSIFALVAFSHLFVVGVSFGRSPWLPLALLIIVYWLYIFRRRKVTGV